MNLLSGMNGLRALAAIIVVVYHLNQQLPTDGLSVSVLAGHNFIARLSLVVSVFFFLSGFFRALSYWKVLDTPEKIPDFWSSLKDRFFRIAPAYYVALVLSIIATVLIGNTNSLNMSAILAGFSFTTWMNPDTLFPVILNGPLWFVSFDMLGWILTSLVMMGLFRVGRRYMIPYFLTVILATFALHELWISLPWHQTSQFPANYWFPLYNPFLFFLHFLFGIIASGIVYTLQKRKVQPHVFFDIGVIIIGIVFSVFIWFIRDVWDDFAYSYPKGPYYFPWIQILIALGCSILPFTRYIGTWLDNRFALFTAKISYSLYLIHGVIIAFLLAFVFRNPLSVQEWGAFVMMTIAFSYLAAFLLYRFVEVPSIPKKQK
ncbi:MAG: acyltransferase [Candidatus Gracilibacteria bacterium]|nr:acyltransferase [Candidatus Gracilibacteria bacterium]